MSGLETVVAHVPAKLMQLPLESVPSSRSYTRVLVSSPEPVSEPSDDVSATERLV